MEERVEDASEKGREERLEEKAEARKRLDDANVDLDRQEAGVPIMNPHDEKGVDKDG